MRVSLKSFTSVIVVLALLISVSVFVSSTTAKPIGKRYLVKLYSAGTVVATWADVRNLARGDANSLSFHIGSESTPMLVQIAGTYSAEQTAE